LVRAAAAVWEPAAARQRGPAAPNQAAARRPCSDLYDAVARQRAAARAQVLQRARLQARGWMLERAAAMQARLATARYFREQRLLA
jgi:flagellar motility protein MotE (MotC chaperone)